MGCRITRRSSAASASSADVTAMLLGRPACSTGERDDRVMELVRHADRITATLKPRGWARLVVAAFLALWLCPWAVGEGVTLYVGAGLLRSLFAEGTTPAGWLVAGLIALAVGGWLVLWTLGGAGALHTLGMLLIGSERLEATPRRLVVESAVGFWRKRRTLGAAQITSLAIRRRDRRLVALTGDEAVVLSWYAEAEDRQILLEALQATLQLAPPSEPLHRQALLTTPADFDAVREADGATLLVPIPALGRRQARTALLLAVIFGAAAAGIGLHSLGGGAVLGAPAVLLLLVTLNLRFGRVLWRLRQGHLERRRELFGRSWAQPFPSPSLRLMDSTDSDGDHRFTLEVASGPTRRAVLSSSDPAKPLHLARWLAARLDAPLQLPPRIDEW